MKKEKRETSPFQTALVSRCSCCCFADEILKKKKKEEVYQKNRFNYYIYRISLNQAKRVFF